MSRDAAAMAALPVSRAEVHVFSIDKNNVFRVVWERKAHTPSPAELEQLQLITGGDAHEAYRTYVRSLSTPPANEWKIVPAPKKNERFPSRWAHTFLPTTRLYLNESQTRAARPQTDTERQLDAAFSESINKAWLQFYNRTLTEVRQIQESGLRTVLQHVISPQKEELPPVEHDLEDTYRRVTRFLDRQSHVDTLTLGKLVNFQRRYRTEQSLRRIVDNLDFVERRIEEAMAPVDQFTTIIKKLFSRGKSLKLGANELEVMLQDGRSISIAQLSSGEKHLIKILLAAMMSNANSVLIDEPELSMHIDWQRIFVQTVRTLNPNCQLLVASHSPEIMADVSDDCIFRL